MIFQYGLESALMQHKLIGFKVNTPLEFLFAVGGNSLFQQFRDQIPKLCKLTDSELSLGRKFACIFRMQIFKNGVA